MSRLLAVALMLVTLLAAPLRADDIKIGHYGSLTGSEATFGQSTSNGLKLAIAEINAAGGINGSKIVLVEYDTKGDTKEAGAVVTRLCTKDHVTAVIGEVASSLSLAGAPICQQNNIPMISPSSTNPKVTQQGDMIFRACFMDSFQGYAEAKFAWHTKHFKTAAVLLDQSSAYSVGLAEFFSKEFEKFGGKVVIKQQFAKGEQDFTAKLTAIRDTNPDVLFVPAYYNDVANIAVQARKLGIKAPLLGGDGWDSAKLFEMGGKAIEGSFYSNHAAPDAPGPVLKAFVDKYKDEYGPMPDALGALGYDSGKLLFDAMKRAKSLGGRDLANAIGQTKDFEGASGVITIDENRDAKKDCVILEIVDGKPTYRATIKPE